MAKEAKETKGAERRTSTKDLPRPEKALGKDEQKRVKGGAGETIAVIPSRKDGSDPRA